MMKEKKNFAEVVFNTFRDSRFVSAFIESKRVLVTALSFGISEVYYRYYGKIGYTYEVKTEKGRKDGLIRGFAEFSDRTLRGAKRKLKIADKVEGNGIIGLIDLNYTRENPKKLENVEEVDLGGIMIYLVPSKESIIILSPFDSQFFLVVSDQKPDWITGMVRDFERQDTEGLTKVYALLTSLGGDIKEKALWFDKVNVNIEENYNTDFDYEKLRKFCVGKKDGLAILCGLPGTGKTTLIKKLMEDCKDETKFFIIKSSQLDKDSTESYMEHFLDNSGAVYVLEDCEDLLMSRDMVGAMKNNSQLSTLLNITDGILGAVLNIKFICTFNTDLRNIDSALLRKGRLRFKYEFGKLELEKTKGLWPDAEKEMTLAEIYNKDEENYSTRSERNKKIGF